MNCIAVDDEPRALEIIENYARKIDFLDLYTTFRNPVEAVDYLMEHTVDLVFLDINMPDIRGTEMVKIISPEPMVIFTTAYSEYAIESYELDAIDYLLKPFEFDRFLKAVLKAKNLLELRVERSRIKPVPSAAGSCIQIKSGTEIHQVKTGDILFIEGLGNYIKVHLPEKNIVTYISLKDFLAELPDRQFIRIHKSYIVSIQHITSFESHRVNLGTQTLPVGKRYRKQFLDAMSRGKK